MTMFFCGHTLLTYVFSKIRHIGLINLKCVFKPYLATNFKGMFEQKLPHLKRTKKTIFTFTAHVLESNFYFYGFQSVVLEY